MKFSIAMQESGTDILTALLPFEALALPYTFARHARAVPVQVACEPDATPCVVADEGLRLNVWEADALARYTGVPVGLYLLGLLLAGVIQWRVLRRNPLLVPEDLVASDRGCFVQAVTRPFESFVPALDCPELSEGTRWFLGELATPEEIAALERVLARMRRAAPATV